MIKTDDRPEEIASSTTPGQALRRRAEEIEEKQPRRLEDQQMHHELRVHQIELEIQNEELRRAQVELDVSRARYFDLYDLAPVGYCTLSEQGLILEANLTAATLLGVVKSTLAEKPFTHFILPKDQDIYYLHRKNLIETKKTQSWELRMVRNDATTFWGHLTATVLQGKDGEPLHRVVMSDVAERKRDEEQIKSLLEEKELLLHEVHHRIKNNMNTIMSLLSLQSGMLKDPSAITAFEDSRSRVRSMMILYDKLYRSDDFRTISTKEYLTSLVNEIIAIFPNRGRVAVETQIDDMRLGAKILSPVGIIINELLTNTMKHAFLGREDGLIRVCFSFKENHALLTINDNGAGIPDHVKSDHGRRSTDIDTSTGFGMQLVDILTKQLKGTMRYEREKGATFILEFEV